MIVFVGVMVATTYEHKKTAKDEERTEYGFAVGLEEMLYGLNLRSEDENEAEGGIGEDFS